MQLLLNSFESMFIYYAAGVKQEKAADGLSFLLVTLRFPRETINNAVTLSRDVLAATVAVRFRRIKPTVHECKTRSIASILCPPRNVLQPLPFNS